MTTKCIICGGYVPDLIFGIDRNDCKNHKKYPKSNINDAIKEQISIRNED